ncbi:hypothetical protein NC651_021271 [Populus alba x Populus x berolinensis]|nr:hypothetical protein NC651_021271 [Populus alba x Populus x berolinensis]
MNFFKSVFDEDTAPPNNPSSDNPDPEPEQEPEPEPSTLNLAWSFDSLIKTISTKSESIIQTYKKDLQELRSGFNKETAVIRHVASRAVHDLPASFESGAAVAQQSLESVGQVIDDIGSTVWNSTAQIISHGKDSVFLADDHHRDLNDDSDASSSTKRHHLGVKYSRFDAQVRALQCDLDTYCSEPGDKEDYEKWESEGFQAEEARALLVKRAISGDEEEDLSWDFDDDDHEEEEGNGFLSKCESNKESVIEKEITSLQEEDLGWDEIEYIGSNDESKVEAAENTASAGTSRVELNNRFGSAEEEDLRWDVEDEDEVDLPVK